MIIISLLFSFFVAFHSIRSIITKRKHILLRRQLSDFIDNMTSALSAGSSFLQSYYYASNNTEDPLKPYLEIVIKENQLGISIDKSLLNLSKISPIDEMKYFLTAVRISSFSGGRLTKVFSNLSETLREQIYITEKGNALVSQAKLQAGIVSLLPIIIFFIMYFINSSTIIDFINSSWFEGFFSLTIFLQSLGFLWMNRILNFEI